MPDALTIDAELASLFAAFDRVPATLEPRLLDVARVTANAMASEARERLQRQLGPNATGAMVNSIKVLEDYTGNGFVVLTDLQPEQAISLHTMKRSGRMHTQQVSVNLLPVWLEKGTKPGTRKDGSRTHPNVARPYFYVSILLQQGTHERRMLTAMRDAAAECGLGD